MKGLCSFSSKETGFPDSVVNIGKHHAHEVNRETALHTSQKKEKHPMYLHLPPSQPNNEKPHPLKFQNSTKQP